MGKKLQGSVSHDLGASPAIEKQPGTYKEGDAKRSSSNLYSGNEQKGNKGCVHISSGRGPKQGKLAGRVQVFDDNKKSRLKIEGNKSSDLDPFLRRKPRPIIEGRVGAKGRKEGPAQLRSPMRSPTS